MKGVKRERWSERAGERASEREPGAGVWVGRGCVLGTFDLEVDCATPTMARLNASTPCGCVPNMYRPAGSSGLPVVWMVIGK